MSPIDTPTVTIGDIELETEEGLTTLIDGSKLKMEALQETINQKYAEKQNLSTDLNKLLAGGREIEQELRDEESNSKRLSKDMHRKLAAGETNANLCWLQMEIQRKTGTLLALISQGREEIMAEHTAKAEGLQQDIDTVRDAIQRLSTQVAYAEGMMDLFKFVAEHQDRRGAVHEHGPYLALPERANTVMGYAREIGRKTVAENTKDFMRMCLHRTRAAYQSGPLATQATIRLAQGGRDWPNIKQLTD